MTKSETDTAQPDFIYDPTDWEATYPYEERELLVEDDYWGSKPALGEVKEFATLIRGPKRYAAHVVVTRDEDGEPDDTDIQWFDTLPEAQAAIRAQGKGNAL